VTAIHYPPRSYDECTRQQLITTCIALEDQRDRALRTIERVREAIKIGAGIDVEEGE
jgi:hypothetical protein